MTPDYDNYQPSTEYFLELIERSGKSRAWCARQLGIGRTRITELAAGRRVIKGKIYEVHMTYLEQFALEALASAGQVMQRK